MNILITGASRGIGAATLSLLLEAGHRAVGHSTRGDGGLIAGDLTDPAAPRRIFEEALARLDRIDVLVHSAGIEDGGAVADTDRAVWERVFAANLFAVADLTRAALPALRASRGLVVAINSGSGFASAPGGGVYAASKFALRAFADALREEEREEEKGSRIVFIGKNLGGETNGAFQRSLDAALREG